MLTARDALSGYLRDRAGDFLRGLRLYGDSGSGAAAAAAEQAVRELRDSARGIGSTLETYGALFDPAWAGHFGGELAWLSATLGQEQACAARLHRLVSALGRLSGLAVPPASTRVPAPAPEAAPGAASVPRPSPGPGANGATVPRAAVPGGAPAGEWAEPPVAAPEPAPAPPAPPGTATLTVGASRAGALLDRQLTLARTRAHTAALRALGSSRFHAVADAVAVLASDVPLRPTAQAPAEHALAGPGEAARRRLLDAVAALPLARAAHPYNAEALLHGLSAAPGSEAQDAPWHRVRHLLRLHRCANEARGLRDAADAQWIEGAARALDRHRDAAEAAAAAASAARTPRIAPATAYALGVLHADQRLEVEAARFAFQRLWQQHAADAAR
ncbi:CHAD domain-containing protein [Streptomyces sp. NRRL F-5126]|uniref:CHAD domain-containing protein n=1 Tax=Streptomyces sp. NRRL F-5126 TaxID=1463857 RepID=UPI00055C439F|nr:CHAD domain-containing protein [Streptomyces sp. NRRL F-5126]